MLGDNTAFVRPLSGLNQVKLPATGRDTARGTQASNICFWYYRHHQVGGWHPQLPGGLSRQHGARVAQRSEGLVSSATTSSFPHAAGPGFVFPRGWKAGGDAAQGRPMKPRFSLPPRLGLALRLGTTAPDGSERAREGTRRALPHAGQGGAAAKRAAPWGEARPGH